LLIYRINDEREIYDLINLALRLKEEQKKGYSPPYTVK